MRPTFMLLFLAVIFSNFKAQLTVANFKVDALSTANHRMDYSYDISGTYFKLDMYVYKNSVSQDNLISYNSQIDESNFDQFTFPPGYRYSTYSLNYYQSTTPTKFILVIDAWENPGMPKMTQTLTYTPPVPVTPNFKIDGFVITEPSNNNKIIFDSYNPSQYVNPKFVQFTKNYNFKVYVKKEGAVAVNNVNIDLLMYDAYWGTYPNTSPGTPKNQKINFAQNETVKSVDFLSNVYNISGSTITLGIVFHVDRNNNIAETNEGDNYLGVHGIGYPAGTTLKIGNSGELEGNIDVSILDENGKYIKTLSTSADDKEFSEVKKQLEPGNYIFKANNSTQRVKIYR